MKGSKAMANENKLQEIIAASLENIRSMVDANTVIGDPINTPQGTTIIPVSKVSMGYVSSGSDYAGKHSTTKNNSFVKYSLLLIFTIYPSESFTSFQYTIFSL